MLEASEKERIEYKRCQRRMLNLMNHYKILFVVTSIIIMIIDDIFDRSGGFVLYQSQVPLG